MTLLTRDAILARSDLRSEVVDVPEWGGAVRVREMTGAERDAWEAGLADLQVDGKLRLNGQSLRASLVVRCVVDDDGRRVFADGDAAELGALSAAALSRVYNVAARLSHVTPTDLEELAGN